ncbi:MAG: methionine synthase [Chloroflexi bacterium]|nr:methionine synthase [Chloroflexota bacterium]
MTNFHFLATHVGSVPHAEPSAITQRVASLLDIPCWLQLPRRHYLENIYTQYAATLPGAVVDAQKEKAVMHTDSTDFDAQLEAFYQSVIDDDLNHFALTPDCALGFFTLLDELKPKPAAWVKGQVMGPISFGLTVTDQDLRASLYNEILADALVKNMSMNARWQIRQLKNIGENVIMFVDEPYMASFGSAFISLSREQALGYMNEVYDAVHAEGALVGVHCCGNTDWGLLLDSKADILNLDAYAFLENLALYPSELRVFLDRGGAVCWGLVPNDEKLRSESPASLVKRMREGLQLVHEKAGARGVRISVDELAARSLVSPVCGLGSTTIEIAEEAFEKTAALSELLKQG